MNPMRKSLQTIVFALIALATSAFAQDNSPNAGPVFGNGGLPEILQPFDLNTNGVLEVEERQAMVEARRNMRAERKNPWDLNGDGRLDAEEREAARQALRDQAQARRDGLFNRADTDGDGALNLDEFAALPAVKRLDDDRVAALFGQLDADADGAVALEEFNAHLRNRHDVGPPEGAPERPDTPGHPDHAGPGNPDAPVDPVDPDPDPAPPVLVPDP